MNTISQHANSISNVNGDACQQDSNDSAVQSDYDDSASDENSKSALTSKKNISVVSAEALDTANVVETKVDKEQELVLVQENLFNVKIICPGIDTFEVQVSWPSIKFFEPSSWNRVSLDPPQYGHT